VVSQQVVPVAVVSGGGTGWARRPRPGARAYPGWPYLTGYRRVLPVDHERVRLWQPVSLLAIWSAAEASQRGFFGSEPRLPARLIGWAAREFHRAAADTG
jgi:hypothetical protein